jgi:SSS family solute:Na+ symporter
MVKPESEWTAPERESVIGFREYQDLLKKQEFNMLTQTEEERLHVLQDKKTKGELNAYISYVNRTVFFLRYGGITVAYVIMGGLFAAAFTDVIQGLLILFLSVILIPIGLAKLGGFTGLHAAVPDYMFDLFGSSGLSEYTWYFVLAMVVTNLVGLAPRGFTIGGSAKDDNTARFGYVAGAFAKIFIMVGWALTGVVAIGLYAGELSDATYIWGHMTLDLLGTGFIGVMLASVIAANMANKAATSLEWSAGFTKNILLPLRPNTSEKTQVLVGRLVIFVVLMGSIAFAYTMDDILVVFKYVLSIGTIIGPSIWLVYFWKRLNTKAVIIQMILSICVTVVLPITIPSITNVGTNPNYTIRTIEQISVIRTKAVKSDVTLGKAEFVGQEIEKIEIVPPTGIFFENVAHKIAGDTNSPLVGQGLFRIQLYFCHSLGFDLQGLNKAMLSTISFIFDVFFPFIILLVVSLLTKPNSDPALTKFYACILTPTVADHAQDAKNVQDMINDTELFKSKKLFPNSNWMFWKPTKLDIWGFIGCWILVGFIIWLYYFVTSIGA